MSRLYSFLSLLLGLLCCAVGAVGQDTATLRIEVRVPDGTGTVYLPGSLPELGPWDPRLYEMKGTGDLRTAELSVPIGTKVEFKFTEGGWFREALNDRCLALGNKSVTVTTDTIHRTSVSRFRSMDVECAWPDPTRFEQNIAKFEETDAQDGITTGTILATGSSSIGVWHRYIREDLAPFTITPRGFGGSNMNDLLHYFDRVVLPYQPSAIIVYEGDNDIAFGMFPRTVIDVYMQFVRRVRAELPQTRLYILSIKPSESRWELWPRMQEVNAALRDLAADDPLIHFVDVATPLLGSDGRPRSELFASDKLHLNRAGYEVWAPIVLNALKAGEPLD